MKYIVANWKMNLGIRESVALARNVVRSLRGQDQTPDVILCPPFTALSEVNKTLARSRIDMAAQNAGVERSGAYTGEISPQMLEDVGVTMTLVGHSERRYIFNETDEIIRRRIEAIFNSKLIPIICIGETEEAREGGDAKDFILNQISVLFDGLKVSKMKKIVIAYEPVWAIGSGNPAGVVDVIEMHELIRDEVSKALGRDASDIAVLYGGSINGKNAYEYLREAEIDGLLIGGASLKISEFTQVLESAIDVLKAQQN